MSKNRLFEMKETCNFQGNIRIPRLGIRAYWNQDGWNGSYFPCRGNLWTKAFNWESQDIFRCLVTQFDNLERLRKFCKEHPESYVSEHEYDFFMNGCAADYWIRFITRENDYNLYLKGFAKDR